MIESIFNVLKDGGGCVNFCIEPLDDIPDTVRFQVSESSPNGKDVEEYGVDCALELDELEYIARRILDAIAYQRKQNFGVLSETPVAVPPEELFTSHETREYYALKALLEKHLGDRKAAARELGVSERTLYRKIAQYKLI